MAGNPYELTSRELLSILFKEKLKLFLVFVVLCGLVVGFASLGLTHLGGGHVDLSALLFEPTPSDWLQL